MIVLRTLHDKLDDGHAEGETGELLGHSGLRGHRRQRRRQQRGRPRIPVPGTVPAVPTQQLPLPVAVPIRTAVPRRGGTSAAVLRAALLPTPSSVRPVAVVPPGRVPGSVSGAVPSAATTAAVRTSNGRGRVPFAVLAAAGTVALLQTARRRTVLLAVAAAVPGSRSQQTGRAGVPPAARRRGGHHGRDQQRRTIATVRTGRFTRQRPVSLLEDNIVTQARQNFSTTICSIKIKI